MLRKLLILAIFGCIVAPQSVWADKVFFHWGNADANARLLWLGGYDFKNQAHFYDLNYHGSSATVNQAVMDQIHEWYVSAKSSDAAGSGLYESTDLFDSHGYGPDLLIVTVPDDFKPSTKHDIRTRSDQAHLSGNFDDVSLMTQYANNWHVVSRVPNGKEPQITFRPPRESDVDNIWKQISPKERLSFLSALSRTVAYENGSPSTRPAVILFHRLLFDRGFDHLQTDFIDKKSTSSFDDASLMAITSIATAFSTIIPKDARTHALINFWFKKVYERPDYFIGTSLDFINNVHDILDPSQRQLLMERVFTRTHPQGEFYIFKNFQTLVALLEKYRPSLDPRLVKAAAFKLTSILKKGRFLLKDIPSLLKFSQTYMKDDPEAFNLIMLKLSGAVVITKDDQAKTRADTIRKILAESQTYDIAQQTTLLKNILLPLKLENPQLLAFFPYGEEGRITPIPFPGHLQDLSTILVYMYDHVSDPAAYSAWSQTLHKTLRARVSGKPVLETMQFAGTDIFASSASNEEFLKNIYKVAGDFPELIPALSNEIELQTHERNQDEIKFYSSDISQKLKAMRWKNDKAYRTIIQKRFVSANQFSFSSARELNLKKYLKNEVMPLQQPIKKSLAYSRLNKIFVLIDPLFLTEDLRVRGASRPEHRFNEDYIIDDRIYSQPAWQNLNEAWDQLSFTNWWKYVSQENLSRAMILGQVRDRLLFGKVDGTKGSTREGMYETNSWDRAKYPTVFSDEQWQVFEGERSRNELATFFDITDEPGRKILRFKTGEEWRNSLPGFPKFPFPNQQEQLDQYIVSQVQTVADPVARAARILHLVTKLHPAENGNGRFGRLWASMELAQAGYSIPVGLPTNDFLMSEEHLKLEVRKALVLGRLWKNMLNESSEKNIEPEKFFQGVFRGSALEGLIHVSPTNTEELRNYVNYLEGLKEAPAWAKEFLGYIENGLWNFRGYHGTIGRTSEADRALFIESHWQSFKFQKGINLQDANHARDKNDLNVCAADLGLLAQ